MIRYRTGAIRFAALAVAFALTGPAVAREPAKTAAVTWETLPLCDDTPFATSAFVQDAGKPGPTVLIVSGLHGDEPASSYAAEQIRHWPLLRGRVVMVPRANVPALRAGQRLTPGVDRAVSNLNRNFPLAASKSPSAARGEQAQALWALARQEKPAWVLDLHEGFDVRRKNEKSVGRSIIAARDPLTDSVVTRMLADVNATISDATTHFVRLTHPVDGGIARAAAAHLGARTMIVETATKGLARSSRARQHRIMVHRFLRELKMLAPGVEPADVGFRNGKRARRVIGVYDGGGATGRGVPNLLAQLPEIPDVAVARIGPTEIRAGSLARFDVVVFPGGMGGTQSRYLQEDGRKNVRAFVQDGGGYVGICAGAYLACRGFSWGLGILDAKTKSNRWNRGVGTVRMEFSDSGRNLFARDNASTGVLYANGPILAPAGDDGLPDFETLAVYRTELAENGTPKGIMKDSPAVVRSTFGKGRVVAFGPHPEQTKDLHDLVRQAVVWADGERR